MGSQASADIYLLLGDYGKSLARRARGRSLAWPASDRPLWLQVEDFDSRLRWQGYHGEAILRLPRREAAVPTFLNERFDPCRRFREAPGAGAWPADETTPVQLEARWSWDRIRRQSRRARAVSAALHTVALGFLIAPRTLELDFPETVDWNSQRITLVAPSLDDLPPLAGKAAIQGDGQGGFRGLQAPPPAPISEPKPELVPAPAPEPEAPVAQPLEVPEPEPPEPAQALDEPESEAEPQIPEARSPAPGEFREGPELAQSRDPRVLPMPKAPARKRAALQLEAPKASMPSREGRTQIGSLQLTASPKQVIEGAIQQMVRGGGRQAVGDGLGGLPSASALPAGPSNSGSLVELLSDPRGVDFRPYLTQVLAAVRRNWFAVIPESARFGMSRGRTLIQFSVARNGSVPKLVIAKSSGAPPLDRAAVAGISASNPFPPLPGEYGGREIRLQFTFLYNIRNP